MIISGEGRLACHLARQHSRRQRQSDDHTDLAAHGFLEKQFSRALAEDVEDNLYRAHSWILDRFQRFFYLFDTDPVIPYLASLDQIVQHAKHLGHVIDFGGWAVELQEIQGIRLQVFEAALNKSS